MLAPSHVLHITHPHVTSAYIKQNLESDLNGDQVLVLETDIDMTQDETDEDKYFDLLVDLQDIQRHVEKQFGNISRVDIRAH